jgi:hypothetical protein
MFNAVPAKEVVESDRFVHLQFSFLFRSTDPLLAFSEIQWPSRECLVKRQVKRLSLPATAAQIFETLIVVLVVRDSYSVPIRRRI